MHVLNKLMSIVLRRAYSDNYNRVSKKAICPCILQSGINASTAQSVECTVKHYNQTIWNFLTLAKISNDFIKDVQKRRNMYAHISQVDVKRKTGVQRCALINASAYSGYM